MLATAAESYRDHTLITVEFASSAAESVCDSLTTEVRVYDATGHYMFTADTTALAVGTIDALLSDGGAERWEA